MVLQPSLKVVKQTALKEKLFRLNTEIENLNAELDTKAKKLEQLHSAAGQMHTSDSQLGENERQVEALTRETEGLKLKLVELNAELETFSLRRAKLAEQGEASVDLTEVKAERFSTEPAGYLLTRIGLILLIGVMGLAVWLKQTGVAVMVGLILIAALVSKLWSRFSLARLSLKRELSETRLFPGESVELKFKLTNKKILPLPWLQVYDEIPPQLAKGLPAAVENYPGSFAMSYNATLPWYSSISWRSKIPCNKRGYYRVGPATLTSGDILGFYPRSEYRRETDNIIVYPKLYPVYEAGFPSLYPMGETRASRYIFEDPTRPIGVRDYNYQDSLRFIHWKASARHQNLKVKVFEPTTTLKVVFFLAVDTFPRGTDDINEDNFELGVSAVASLSSYLVEHRSSAGVLSNSALAGANGDLRILPGSDEGHLLNILESLARVTPYPSVQFEEFFEKERASLPWGMTLALVLSEPPEGLAESLVQLKKRGHKLLIIQVGKDTDLSAFYGIPVCRIKTPADLERVAFREAV